MARQPAARASTAATGEPGKAKRPTVIDKLPFRRQLRARERYPRQFWLLFWGLVIDLVGYSMIWPFLTIYLRQRLDLPLATVAILLTVNSAATLTSTAITGPVLDRFGRKRAMVVGLLGLSATLVTMSAATSLPLWIVLLALQGTFSPMYRVGVDSMVADLVEPERRAGAYALLRTGFNLGIAIGPAIGGFVTARSYALAFYSAATSTAFFGLLLLFFAVETVPRLRTDAAPRAAGLGPVLRDRRFLAFCANSTLATMPSALVMLLLPVYAKENFGVPESQYGFIMATNAGMVVLFQYAISQVSRRFAAFRVLTLGALLYALGAGSVALGGSFGGFWMSMVILTLGEMLLVPTATVLAAGLAPPDMRGRYMSVYGLTWGISAGIGPVIGGFLNDRVAPVAIWYGAFVFGLAAALGYVILRRRLEAGEPKTRPAP